MFNLFPQLHPIRTRLLNGRTLRTRLRATTGTIDLAWNMVGGLVIVVISGVISATVLAVNQRTQGNAVKTYPCAVKIPTRSCRGKGAGSWTRLRSPMSPKHAPTPDSRPDTGHIFYPLRRAQLAKISRMRNRTLTSAHPRQGRRGDFSNALMAVSSRQYARVSGQAKARAQVFAAYVPDMSINPRAKAGSRVGGQFTVRTRSADDVALELAADYLIGAAEDLNAAQHRALRHLDSVFGWPASIAVHAPGRVDIVYAPCYDLTDPRSVRLRIDGNGHVVDGGHGSQWENSEPDHPVIRRLIAESTGW